MMTADLPTDALLRIPTSEDVGDVARSVGLAIPPECMPGVLTNLAILDRHAAIFMERAPGAAA